MADFAEGLGTRLNQERERLELMIDALAAQTGLTEQRIHLLEEVNLPEGPDAFELAALGNAGIDVVYLLTGQRILSQAENGLIENYRTGTDEQKKGSTKAGNAVEESWVVGRARP